MKLTNQIDEQTLWEAQLDMYAGYESGDSARTDRHLHPDVQLWTSNRWEMANGVAGMNEIRAARVGDPPGPRPYTLNATKQMIEVWGDTAVVRHYLVVTPHSGAPDEHLRCTGVWRRMEEGWRKVHGHEEGQKN